MLYGGQLQVLVEGHGVLRHRFNFFFAEDFTEGRHDSTLTTVRDHVDPVLKRTIRFLQVGSTVSAHVTIYPVTGNTADLPDFLGVNFLFGFLFRFGDWLFARRILATATGENDGGKKE